MRRIFRWLKRLVIVSLLLLLLPGGYLWFSTTLPTPERLRAQAARGNTRLLDRHGQLLYTIPDPLSNRQQPVPLDEIPLTLRQATIAVEDRSFYQHAGIDLRGIARALWHNLRSGTIVAGGSTITQQLARNFLLDPQIARQQTLERKLREAVLALKLSLTYSKDEIFALYLNQTSYGGMAYGVEAAAQHYFGKPVRDLDLAESALLAGLPQAPSAYDPLRNPDAALARQADVLAAMVQAGMISPEQAAAAQAEPLTFTGGQAGTAAMHAPHFVYYVLGLLEERIGSEALTRGGLTITTTLDLGVQTAAQEALQRQLALLALPRAGEPGHNVQNGAVVVLHPVSGDILAMVGSPDFSDDAIQGQVNAALAPRQPGSAIKPLTYAAALERGWTAATTILDIPSTFPTREGRVYTPGNYDRTYHGPLSLREALATSSNVAAVRTLDAIGIPALLDMAHRLGITSLGEHSSRYGLALTLGGGEVTLLELTAAYGAFANGGHRVTPAAIVEVTGVPGTAVGAITTRPPQPEPAISPQIAYLLSDILSDRYARMRAFGASSVLDVDRPAAVKTGTTTNWRDNWTVGYTPDRVVGVWVGNADGSPMKAVSGITGAAPVWHEVMLAAHRGLPSRPFVPPDGIVEVEICAEGGMLPAPTCPATRRERFLAGTQPTHPDTTHRVVRIDPLHNCRVADRSHDNSLVAGHTVTRTFRLLPPEAEAWAVANNQPRIPPLCDDEHATAEEGNFSEPASVTTMHQPSTPAPALLAPVPGAVFTLSPGIPRERQRIQLHARAGISSTQQMQVTIVVDGEPVAVFTEPPYQTLWLLTPGTHRAQVQVQDHAGNTWHSEETVFTVLEDTPS